MAVTEGKGGFTLLGLLAPALIVAGGIVYAVTGELGALPMALIWIGLLLLLLFAYVRFGEIRHFVSKRSTKYALNTTIMAVVFVIIVSLVGIMSVRYKVRIDLTADQRYTLSAQTIRILNSLPDDVEAIAFYRSDERTRQAMHDLLKEYSYYSTRFKFRFVDPDKSPAEAVKFGVTSYRTTLIRYGDKQQVIGTESESRLSSALIKLLSDRQKTIYFVKGHGEKRIDSMQADGYGVAREAIEKENHEVSELLLMAVDKVPEDAAVLVIGGPESALLPVELDKITEYVAGGGRALFMLDPGSGADLSGYLSGFGFEVSEDIVIDKLSQVYGANYLTPVVVEYESRHPITREFELATFFPAARSVEIDEDPARGNYSLAKTSANSWTITGALDEENLKFDPNRHRRGPISIAAVAAVEVVTSDGDAGGDKSSQTTKWGKLIVTGDSDFASNTHIKLAGNKDFFLNMVNWLADVNMLISIRTKERGLTPIMMTAAQGRLVFWLSVVVMPSLVIVAGVGMVFRRTR